MLTNKDITIIIPIHKIDGEINNMLEKAYESVPKDMKVIYSVPTTVNIDGKHDNVEIVVAQEGFSTFQELVNDGVKGVKTDWFSILEFDDEYTPICFNNFYKYQEYNQKYNFFLTLNDLFDVTDGKHEFIGNGNEAPWASQFSSEFGVVDVECLDKFFDFYLTGGIFNTSKFKEYGGLKESIKLTFWYEFMLRITKKGENIYIIPKVGYIHNLGRKDSLMMQYKNSITDKESNFWFNEAKKQSYFTQNKEIVYNEEEGHEEGDE